MAGNVEVKVEELWNEVECTERNVVECVEAIAKEKENVGCKGCRDLRLREIGVKLREEELKELNRKVVSREKRIEEEFVVCCDELRFKKEELVVSRREQVKELELELEELSRKWKDLETKEREVKQGFDLLEAKRRDFKVKESVLRLREGKRRSNVGANGKLRGLSKVIESRLKEGWGVVAAKKMDLEREGVKEEVVLKEEEVIACKRLLELRDVDEGCREIRAMEVKKKAVDEGVKRVKSEMNGSVGGLELKRKEFERKRGVEMELREKKLKEGFEAIQAKAKEMELREKEMSARCQELGEREKQVKKCSKGLDLREQCFNEDKKGLKLRVEELEMALRENEGLNAMEGKVKQVDEWRKEMELKKKEISARCQEIGAREKQINRRIKALDLREQCLNDQNNRLKLREEELEVTEKRVNESCKEVERKHCVEIELREKQMKEGFDALEMKEKQVDERRKEMELKEMDVGLRCQEIGAREMLVYKRDRDLELRKQSFNLQCQKVGAREKQVRRRKRYLELREKGLKERCLAQVSKDKETDAKHSAIEFEMKRLNERKQALELIEKQLDQNCQNLKLKEEQVSAIYTANMIIEKDLREYLKTDNKNSRVQVHESDDQILRLCKGMNGKTLQMYLNERFMEHQSMKDKLWNALKLSNDPAKLVLSAVYGFFPPHLERAGDSVFDTRAVRTSCMVMLEYLLNMDVLISEAVKNEAIKVANQWKDGMVAEGVTSVVVLGFLLLLAAYNLGPKYEARELQELCEVIDQHRLTPQIGRRLGLSKPKNDSKDRKKRSATSTESPGHDKHPRVVGDQMFIPYNPTGAMYESAAAPFQYQYPVWSPAVCNCLPPRWCCLCRPLPYPYSQFQFPH